MLLSKKVQALIEELQPTHEEVENALLHIKSLRNLDENSKENDRMEKEYEAKKPLSKTRMSKLKFGQWVVIKTCYEEDRVALFICQNDLDVFTVVTRNQNGKNFFAYDVCEHARVIDVLTPPLEIPKLSSR